MKWFLFLLLTVTQCYGQSNSQVYTTLVVQGSTSTGKLNREQRLMLGANKFIYKLEDDTTFAIINNDIIINGKVSQLKVTRVSNIKTIQFNWLTQTTPISYKILLVKRYLSTHTSYELTMLCDEGTLKYKGILLR